MKLAIAVLLGLVNVQAIRFTDVDTDNTTTQVEDQSNDQPEILDDSDVVIQIYDKNEQNEEDLTPPTLGATDDFVQIKSDMRYRPNPAQSPWAAAPAEAAKTDITGAFTAGEDGFPYYSRVIPSKYDGTDKDDLLLKSVIQNYAVEGKGEDGQPNGKFFLKRGDMDNLADEVLTNNMGFKDSGKKADFAAARLDGIWKHFDLFGKGYIPVEEVPQLCRLLLGEVEVQNSLQVQLDSQINANFIDDKELERPIDQVVLQFRPTDAQVPWLPKTKDDTAHSAIYKAFTPGFHGHEYYERVVPTIWDSTDRDDLLMKSVIEKYALEGRSETDGTPTGKFYLDLPCLYNAGEEVVRTHIGYTGAKNKAYLDEHLPEIFKHMDVNNQGYIIVEKAPQALRLLLGEVEIQNGLQVQLDSNIDNANSHSSTWRPDPTLSPFAAKPAPPGPANAITGGFAADYNKEHLNYDREVPEKFQGDLLMNSIVSKWAIEGKNEDGSKNGKFFMTKDLTREVASEVVQTHMGMTGSAKDAYVNEKLDELWKKYDNLNEGFVPAERIPVLLKSMVGEVETNNGLL